MHLAALPRHAREDCPARRRETVVGVADDELHAMEAPLDQLLEDAPPVQLGLARVGVDGEDGAVSVLEDPGHDEGREVDGDAVDAHFLVGGVDVQDFDALRDSPGTPFRKFLVKGLRGVRHLLRGIAFDAHGLEDRLHPAGRHPLDVHFRGGDHERAFAARATLEALGIELLTRSADLRHMERKLPHPGLKGARLEAVGIAVAAL